MERRYEVFVSSTYDDLKEERQAVMRALLDLDAIPAGMEMFPATDAGAWARIERAIARSDYYVLIIAGRYGSLDANGLGFTEREYDFALSSGIPVLAFVHKDPKQIQSGKTEDKPELRARLDSFKSKVMGGDRHLVKFWLVPEDLTLHIAISLHHAIVNTPRPGWVRAESTLLVDAPPHGLPPVLRAKGPDSKAAFDPTPVTHELRSIDWSLEIALEAMGRLFEWVPSRFPGAPDRKRELKPVALKKLPTNLGALFRAFADEMTGHPIEEGQMQRAIDRHAAKLVNPAGVEWEADENGRIVVAHSQFHEIKAQFHMLGLIEPSTSPSASKDRKFWKLTTLGESSLRTLRGLQASRLDS